jgi:hypothetical protein
MSKDIKKRRYCFTVHNYSKKDLIRFEVLAESLEKHRYIVYGLEIAPDTGTEHIQGYIELNNAQRFTFLHNYFGFKKKGKVLKFHIEIANGTAEENKKYVSKEGKFFEFGEPVKQGARNDLMEIKQAVKDDPKKLNEIIDQYGNNLQQVKFAQTLQPIYLPPRNPKEPPKVLWLFGSSGIGKTRKVYETFDDICAGMYKWLGTGYVQNECFLLDDFRCDLIPFVEVLRITDRYPQMLEFKGGQVPLNSPYIIFTCPNSIEEEFSFVKENLGQLTRRITQVNFDAIENIEDINLRELDEKHIWQDVNKYRNNF